VTINRAQAGETTLDGTGLNNILIGTSGAETLDGNEGRDVLIGNAGNDTFDFNATVDSPSLANADLIGDFEGDGALVGDLINLLDIDANTGSGGDQAFAFVAAQNAGAVANSVTWFQSGGNTIIQADVNGNTTADLVIVMRGLHALTAADFVL
jgi:Ca2+-binding RTX toxin-like protein